MTVRQRLLVLGGTLALAAQGYGQELQWRPVGAAKPSIIIPAQATETALAPQAPPVVTPITPPPVINPIPGFPANEALPAPKAAVVVPPNAGAGSDSPLPMITNPVMAEPGPGGDCGACVTHSINWASPGTWLASAAPADHRAWVRGEFLAWGVKGANFPVLLTTSTRTFPIGNNPAAPVINPARVGNIGSLADPQAVVLLDGNDLNEQFRPGMRFGGGWWFDPCGVQGVDGSIFITPRRTGSYSANTGQYGNLYRPYFAVNRGLPETGGVPGESREVVGVASAGINGQFNAELSSFFWGADLNYRRNLWAGCTTRVDGFAGFRYLHLDERFQATESIQFTRDTTFTDAAGTVVRVVPAGLNISILDRFNTKNNFYGGQVGADVEWRRDRWSLGLRPSIALGCTQQNLNVTGAYQESMNGKVTAGFPGGLYALNSNIGSRSETNFTYVPEVQLKLGYFVTNNLRVTAGYDFLYWSSVIRPGDQIDRNLDVVRVPPLTGGTPVVPASPAPLFNTTDFWAQGVSLGMEYRW
ncbi:MAG: BBP7 family outer membrane beta-barrel protein [Gemmataceae bacterium]|nr:BBP7 family outer membrane beta-barrel protein [Gemmataceae bacterium]